MEKGTQGIDCRVFNVSDAACCCCSGLPPPPPPPPPLAALPPWAPPPQANFLLSPAQPRNKAQQIFVITFGRAGEDNKSFRLTNIESTIAGFAGADYDMCVAHSLTRIVLEEGGRTWSAPIIVS